MEGRARRQSEDETALFLGQSPKIRDGEERAQRRRAQALAVRRGEAPLVETLRSWFDRLPALPRNACHTVLL
jgi:hypothetical protein